MGGTAINPPSRDRNAKNGHRTGVAAWSLVTTLGEDGFASALLAFVQGTCAVEHLVIYRLADQACTLVATAGPDGGGVARCRADAYLAGQFWRRDPALLASVGEQGVVEVATLAAPIDTLGDRLLRDRVYRSFGVRARVLIVGEAAGVRVALSLIRTDPGARHAAADVAKLRALSSDLVTLMAKHILLSGEQEARTPLNSLTLIERRLERTRPRLPRREMQVCARILYGMTSTGISLDLHIGEESAMTYRKRAYARLGIASQRELLMWYLGQAGSVGSPGTGPEKWEAAA